MPIHWFKRASLGLLALSLVLLAAGQDLAAAGKADLAKKYAEDLKSSTDPAVRATALMELGKIGQISKPLVKPAIPDMLAALGDKDPTVRAAAAAAVGLIDPDPKDVLPKLLKLTKKEEPENVRMAALRGLASMGPNARDAMKDLREIVKVEEKDSKIGRAANNTIQAINVKN